ncbi:MAG: TatD family hydrolase [Anaerolineae bacterium]|nr:TatD family hydrolase [Anaerolineae bacterium]
MPDLIDTHAHLDHPKFSHDREAVIQRAFDAGVQPIITAGADMASSRESIALAERFTGIYAAVGVHPHDAQAVSAADLDELRKLADRPQVVAIGEMGLDYYWDHSPHEAQKAVFEAQLGIAVEVGKPAMIHIRDKKGQHAAYEDALNILARWAPNLPSGRVGVLHCFSGDLGAARIALDVGFYLGIDGPVTYPNASELCSIVAQIPLDRLLLETDCPYLTPQFRRGRRNEPAYLGHTAEKIAQVRGISVDQVARATTENARHLFTLTSDV